MIPISAIIIIALGVLICAYLIIRMWANENKTDLVGMEENKMEKELVWTNEDAIKMLKSKMDGNVDTSYEWVETVRLAIKALERPTAGWEKFDNDYIKCSKCERIVKFYHYNYKYCPHCGARMIESEDKE